MTGFVEAARRDKLTELMRRGTLPYAYRFDRSASARVARIVQARHSRSIGPSRSTSSRASTNKRATGSASSSVSRVGRSSSPG